MSDRPCMSVSRKDLEPGDVATFRHKKTGRTFVNWTIKAAHSSGWRLEDLAFALLEEDWEFVSAYRIPVPKYKPGQAGIATISTCETTCSTFQAHGMWFKRGDQPLSFMTDDGNVWFDHGITSFALDRPKPPNRADLANAIAGDESTTSWHTDAADRVIRAYASNLR